MEKVATFGHAVRMLCDDLLRQIVGARSPARSRPRRLDSRVSLACRAAALICRAFDGAVPWIAPASVSPRRRGFIEDNAENAIPGLADVASAAGVSARSLQLAFRRFRDTTPMARLRALRLELARSGWPASRAGRWFGHFGRERAWFRISQPIRCRLQDPVPRAAFRNAPPRRRRTLSYWVTATSTAAICNGRFTSIRDIEFRRFSALCGFQLSDRPDRRVPSVRFAPQIFEASCAALFNTK